MKQLKLNLMNQMQLSEIEADQVVYFFQIIGSDLSKVLIIFIPFLLSGHLVEYLTILILTFLLKSQTGGFHFKNYMSCLTFTFTYFAAVFLMSKVLLPTPVLITIGVFSLLIITWLSPMLSKQRKKLKRINTQVLRIRAVSIAALYLLFFVIKINPFTLCAIWVVVIQSFLLMIQKGVLYVTR
jgi:accessory gene regulator B